MTTYHEEQILDFQLGTLTVQGKPYDFAPLSALDHLGNWRALPYCHKILLENLWRHLDHRTVTKQDIIDLIATTQKNIAQNDHEISFSPARVLMQDLTGVPAVVDLAALRDAMHEKGGCPTAINPLIPVDLVIDHSVMVDHAGSNNALSQNVAIEFERNQERYEFLKWGTKAFSNFRVVPPGTGICHQVNIEHLAKVIWVNHDDQQKNAILYPDTVVGTDSHTTMVNGLGVLGWGVGGIEAEAAMLGQPISMLVPKVLGVHLKGILPSGCTATDLVLTITQILRKKGVVGMFVEFFGEGVDQLSLADRATIANMAPEYGATCGIFPIDDETLAYLRLTGRDDHQIEIVKTYAQAQGLWRDPSQTLCYNETLDIDLSSIVPSLAGPKRPQDRVALSDLKQTTEALILPQHEAPKTFDAISNHPLDHHDVVLAAITSCTNTSNPAVLIAAGLVAKKANALGLKTKPWVKTSLAPGSQVVKDYLEKAGLLTELEALGFHIIGYGCTTCIGNSGPLPQSIQNAIETHDLIVSGVLSGNRNFEGRIHSHIKANYLASPPLVVAFALSGTTHINLNEEPLGYTQDGKAVYLKDVWPSQNEIQSVIKDVMTPDLFKKRYAHVFDGDVNWQKITAAETQTYHWKDSSTYVQTPPYFKAPIKGSFTKGMQPRLQGNILNARILALLGDSITTDHISPAGNIKATAPAGIYLNSIGVTQENFNSYGTRRGNHEVMMRGTFANIRLQNEQVPERTGGWTRRYHDHEEPSEPISIFDAASHYMEKGTPLVIIAGREYGTGSSRDWAAKGTRLLGVSAVIAESFERIHRSNLVGMGVLPLVFESGVTRQTLELKGDEIISIEGFDDKGTIIPRMPLMMVIKRANGHITTAHLICRVDTENEVAYINAGGILPYVLDMIYKKQS